MLKNDFESLVLIWVLEVENDSKLVAPSFAKPKPKSNLVRFLSDLRNLNKPLKKKPYPMPKNKDMIFKLENFQYVTSLDLNMGYYHIWLSENASNLCTIILPWRKYQRKRLPMGVANWLEIP